MKRVCFVIVFTFAFCNEFVAQIDSNSGLSTSIPAIKSDRSNSSSITIKPLDNKGLNNPNSNRINGMSIPNSSTLNDNDQFSMFEKEEFGNPGELYEKKLQRIAEGVEKKPDEKVTGSTTDQYLGDFKTKGKKVTVAYRDYGDVDGDRIRVYADGDVMRSNVVLGGSFSGFELELKSGLNKIDFQALNTGEAGPNTAELMVLDEAGNVIAQEYWALATGVKATIIVVKE